MLVGMINFDCADTDATKRISALEKVGNPRTRFFHALVMDISVEVGIPVGIKSKAYAFVLAMLDAQVTKIGTGPKTVAPHAIAKPGDTFHDFALYSNGIR